MTFASLIPITHLAVLILPKEGGYQDIMSKWHIQEIPYHLCESVLTQQLHMVINTTIQKSFVLLSSLTYSKEVMKRLIPWSSTILNSIRV